MEPLQYLPKTLAAKAKTATARQQYDAMQKLLTTETPSKIEIAMRYILVALMERAEVGSNTYEIHCEKFMGEHGISEDELSEIHDQFQNLGFKVKISYSSSWSNERWWFSF